jgi:hypothetical protein
MSTTYSSLNVFCTQSILFLFLNFDDMYYIYTDPNRHWNIESLEVIFTCGKNEELEYNLMYNHVLKQFKFKEFMHLIFQFKTNKNLLNTIICACIYS